MSKAIAKSYIESRDVRGYVAYALVGICAMLFFVYAMNVYTTVSRTVAIQKLNMEASTLASSVQDLDSKYLTLSDSLTPDSLRSYGMIQGKVNAYIPRNASLGSVAVSAHGL